MALAGAGVAAGLAGAWWSTGLLRNLLFQVEPRDPAAFALLSGIVLFVALIAVAIPARRAVAIDPATALRHE